MAQLEVGPANAGLTGLHLVLLELGVDKLLSRETVLALAQPPAEGEAPFGVKQLMVAERTVDRAPSSIEVATFGDYRKTQARFGALYRDRVPERPVGLRRCFLVVSQGGRRHLLDARGRRLSSPEAQGLAPWVAALDEVVAPQAGDRVLFERDVFADVPGQKAYRVGVRNGDAYRFTGTLGFPVSAGGAD